MLETFTAVVDWLKEYGDVLGGIGAILAMTTLLLTNSKVILARMKGDKSAIPANNIISEGMGTNLDVRFSDAPKPSPEYGGKTAIAILPIKEIGDVPEHFTDGLMEDLIADIQKASFATPDKHTTARIAGESLDVPQAAQALGVNYVLTTSVRHQEKKIRVASQLADHTGAILWSDKFTAVGDDVFAIQESIAAKITSCLQKELAEVGGTLGKTKQTFKTQEEALLAVSSPKSRTVTSILCLLIGIFGVHRFYIGRPFTGILYLFSIGFFGFGWLMDIILSLFGVMNDGKGRPIRLWAPPPQLPENQ